MNKYEIIKRIEHFAPIETAEPWDCVGFMVETHNIDVSKVMLCLTVTEDIVKQASEQNCDMIIAHHPMFVVKCYSELVSGKYSPKIDIYSAHTNIDKAKGGTTDTVIKTLGIDRFCQEIRHEFLRLVDMGQDVALEDFSILLLKNFPNARIVNNRNVKKLRRIAFCAGSGAEFISEAKAFGADALVTGDLKFHAALESEIVVYDIGHFESEILVLSELSKIIGSGVDIVFAHEKSPIRSIA